MTKGNVGSLLVFDPSKITIDQPIKEASGEAVVGIVTERGMRTAMLPCHHIGSPAQSSWHEAPPCLHPSQWEVPLSVPGFPVWCADYLTKVVVLGKSSSELPVSDIMTPQSKLMTVSPQQSVVDVMTLMTDNNFRHVPVARLTDPHTWFCSSASNTSLHFCNLCTLSL